MERMILLKYLNIAKFLDISAKSSFYIKYIYFFCYYSIIKLLLTSELTAFFKQAKLRKVNFRVQVSCFYFNSNKRIITLMNNKEL